MRSQTDADAEEGIIARQAQLNAATEAFDAASLALEETDQRIEAFRTKRSETERSIDAEQEALQGAQQTLSRLDAQRRALITELQQRQNREAQLRQDLTDAEGRAAEERSVIDEANQMLNLARHQVESDEGLREDLETARAQAREQVRQCRQAKQQADVALNRSEVRHRELLTQREALSQSIARAREQVSSYEQREASIRGEMPTDENPDLAAQQELSELLERRLVVESQLTLARQGLSELESALRSKEQARMEAEQAVAGVQTRSEGPALSWQRQESAWSKLTSRSPIWR